MKEIIYKKSNSVDRKLILTKKSLPSVDKNGTQENPAATSGLAGNSTKIFSPAKNLRMLEQFEHENNNHWNYEDMFTYHDLDQQRNNCASGAIHIIPNEIMKRFIPRLEDIHFIDP